MSNVEGRGEEKEMLSGGWLDFGENKHRHHTELGMSGMREESVTSEPFLKLKVSDFGCLHRDLIWLGKTCPF